MDVTISRCTVLLFFFIYLFQAVEYIFFSASTVSYLVGVGTRWCHPSMWLLCCQKLLASHWYRVCVCVSASESRIDTVTRVMAVIDKQRTLIIFFFSEMFFFAM